MDDLDLAVSMTVSSVFSPISALMRSFNTARTGRTQSMTLEPAVMGVVLDAVLGAAVLGGIEGEAMCSKARTMEHIVHK